jgi:hypothetical protein
LCPAAAKGFWNLARSNHDHTKHLDLRGSEREAWARVDPRPLSFPLTPCPWPPATPFAAFLAAPLAPCRPRPPCCLRGVCSTRGRDQLSLFVRLISHQPTVLFSQNKPAIINQPTVLFSHNKSAPAISHQPNEQADQIAEAAMEISQGGGKRHHSQMTPLIRPGPKLCPAR